MKSLTLLTHEEVSSLRYVLMDIDDTLTVDGKLLAQSYDSLWRLKEAGFKVIPVTGRPAGWCDLIARQWPIDGIIGENGAFAFWETEGKVLKTLYHPHAVRNDHLSLQSLKEKILKEVSGLRVAKDQFSRLFDIAFDFAEEEPFLPLSSAEKAASLAISEGAFAKVSSIHVNVWMGCYDKSSMAKLFLRERFGWQEDLAQVLFAGDSPNDEPLFASFPLSFAVANIRAFLPSLTNPPAFIAEKDGGYGFAEIVDALFAARAK